MLGKRMAFGWYQPPDQSELQRFFDYIKSNSLCNQDDFILAMESCEGGNCFTDWDYDRKKFEKEKNIHGFMTFKLKEE